jgi:hypothetical protein
MVASRQLLLLLKNKTANTQDTSKQVRQKEVNSTGWWYTLTCELDLLCMAVVVVLVTNLIYFSEEIKNKSVEK